MLQVNIQQAAFVRQLADMKKCLMLNACVKALSFIAIAVSASPAFAQTATDAVEAVTVTGSRIISDITLSPTPLTVVTADQLQATTPSNIPDGLEKLPVFLGSRSTRNVQNGSSNNTGNVLNLRNFGVARTLVLLDGHRVAPSNADGSVDTDVLPSMLMSRVDVVTGGASAIYGSDAVAGVVNFVLDKKFTGFKYNASSGISNYSDAALFQLGAAWGTELFNGRGHLEASMRYFHQDGVPISARPYGFNNQSWVQSGAGTAASPFRTMPFGRQTTLAMTGTILCGSSCAANNKTFVTQGVIGPLDPGTPTQTSGLNSGGDGGYNQATSFNSNLRTAEAFGRFSYDLDDTTSAYFQTTFSESGNQAYWSPVTVSNAANRPNTFFANNAFLPAATQAILATASGSFAAAGGLPAKFQDTGYMFNNINGIDARASGRTYRSNSIDRNLGVTAGVDGQIFHRFDWDAYYTHGESRQKEFNPNNTDNARFLAAQDAVLNSSGQVVCYVSTTAYANLYPGCAPLNLFGPKGPSDAAFNFISRQTQYIQTNILDDVGGSVAGPVFSLPAGDVKVALSAEMRWAKYDVQSSADPTETVDCTGLRICTPNAIAKWTQNTAGMVSASQNVYEFAAEVNVPILKDVPLIQDLSADIAGRYTNYSSSGSAQTWKLGLDYHVNETVRFRGTMSVDIRAPNLNDLYQPLLISSSGFLDLYTQTNSSVKLYTQGNSKLTPEIAHTMTAGIVLTPDFIPGFTASLDYYKINMSNAITALNYTNISIQNICIASGGTSIYCSLASRPLPFSNNTPANYPDFVIAQSLNSAKVKTEGLDFEVDYNFDMSDIGSWLSGNVELRDLFSYQPYITTIGFPGAAPSYAIMPKSRMSTFLTYTLGNWSLNLQNTWLSGFSKLSSPGLVYAASRVNSFDTLDVTLDRRFDFDGGPMDLYFSVQNIGNTQPPLYPTNSSNPGLFYPAATFENGMGRYFTLGIRGSL